MKAYSQSIAFYGTMMTLSLVAVKYLLDHQIVYQRIRPSQREGEVLPFGKDQGFFVVLPKGSFPRGRIRQRLLDHVIVLP